MIIGFFKKCIYVKTHIFRYKQQKLNMWQGGEFYLVHFLILRNSLNFRGTPLIIDFFIFSPCINSWSFGRIQSWCDVERSQSAGVASRSIIAVLCLVWVPHIPNTKHQPNLFASRISFDMHLFISYCFC